MGNPKQKWTSEEEDALRAGVAKHGTGKWKNILRDPEFAPSLKNRSNIDLKVPIALSFSCIGYFFNFDCASFVFPYFPGYILILELCMTSKMCLLMNALYVYRF